MALRSKGQEPVGFILPYFHQIANIPAVDFDLANYDVMPMKASSTLVPVCSVTFFVSGS